MTNVSPSILNKVGRNLHKIPHHPVNITKQRVVNHFHKTFVNRVGNAIFAHFDDVEPVVTTEQNFDSLLVPTNHVSRSRNDNYYVNNSYMLRAHTSAHQRDFVKMGFDRFLVTGDVYRRDEIDGTHYPVFHQMEGVRLYTKHELFRSVKDDLLEILEQDADIIETDEKQKEHTLDAVRVMELDLKQTLEDLVKHLFGKDLQTRWVPAYFPFTHPSYELEIYFRDEWVEMLGSGIMRQGILVNGGAESKVGWAFGLGLDRLAMLLFDIPDIRLLWTIDSRFLEQFESVTLDPSTNVKFRPFSKYPPCYKDISFWLGSDFSQNDFYELVRSVAGDIVEKVDLIDEFVHPRTSRTSHCYRITYRSMDRTVTDEEINQIQHRVRQETEKMGLELR